MRLSKISQSFDFSWINFTICLYYNVYAVGMCLQIKCSKTNFTIVSSKAFFYLMYMSFILYIDWLYCQMKLSPKTIRQKKRWWSIGYIMTNKEWKDVRKGPYESYANRSPLKYFTGFFQKQAKKKTIIIPCTMLYWKKNPEKNKCKYVKYVCYMYGTNMCKKKNKQNEPINQTQKKSTLW